MLARIVEEGLLTARGVFGLWPARPYGDDIEVCSPVPGSTTPIAVLHTLRQQRERSGALTALADFVAPAGDHVGAFAVAIHGGEELADGYEQAGDDYSSILVKALADRLAEAFAEWLHREVRTRHWGYAPDEDLPVTELIKERYAGIRPAPGYPAQPEHTEKATLARLLGTEDIGMAMTESFAMTPTSAVSGLYFGHQQSRYFALGRIARDQVADYAERKGWTLEEAERWLAPNLGVRPGRGLTARPHGPRLDPCASDSSSPRAGGSTSSASTPPGSGPP